MNEHMTNTQNSLSIAMAAAVPLRIMGMQEKGGPDDADFDRAQRAGELLGEKGDLLLFKSKKEGETARTFNETAHAIAILAFCPGGITIFGQCFEGRMKVEKLERLRGLQKKFNRILSGYEKDNRSI